MKFTLTYLGDHYFISEALTIRTMKHPFRDITLFASYEQEPYYIKLRAVPCDGFPIYRLYSMDGKLLVKESDIVVATTSYDILRKDEKKNSVNENKLLNAIFNGKDAEKTLVEPDSNKNTCASVFLAVNDKSVDVRCNYGKYFINDQPVDYKAYHDAIEIYNEHTDSNEIKINSILDILDSYKYDLAKKRSNSNKYADEIKDLQKIIDDATAKINNLQEKLTKEQNEKRSNQSDN